MSDQPTFEHQLALRAQPILVTGAPRSGTTWIGRLLARASNTAYISEPFNIDHDHGLCGARFRYYFTYLCKANEKEYLPYLTETMQLQYRPMRSMLHSQSVTQCKKALVKAVRFRKLRAEGARPLLKDPIAVFSAPWLAERFNVATLVMIRHPAAFVRSYLAKKWTHPFSHFLAQPILMEERLASFAEEIRFFAERPQPIIDQAALLWKLIYSQVSSYKAQHPEWLFLRHEDLSGNPIEGCAAIYSAFRLKFSEEVERTVMRYSRLSQYGTETSTDPWLKRVRRSSLAVAGAWRDELSQSDVRRIKRRVSPISDSFYSPDEW